VSSDGVAILPNYHSDGFGTEVLNGFDGEAEQGPSTHFMQNLWLY
jgi:hypothetical protein